MSTLIRTSADLQATAPPQTRLPPKLLYVIGLATVSIGAVVILLVAAVTLFQAKRFYREVMARRLARIGLRMTGVRLVVHQGEPLPPGQVVFVSNHSSRIDFFVLVALGLRNTRFFLSGFVRKIVPIGIIGYVCGVFWTALQKFPEKRVKIFQRAERVLRRTGESVYLSPEGIEGNVGEIAPFNKGAFHLATNLGAPIVPFFIYIPREIDPGWAYIFRPGVVHVYFQSAIDTSDWRLEELDKNRTQVRDLFVELDHKYHGGNQQDAKCNTHPSRT